MSAQLIVCDSADVAHARAAAYALIAHGFAYPDELWRSDFAEASHWTGWPDRLAEADRSVAGPLWGLRSAAENTATEHGIASLQKQFSALFGHAVRGACPPYELEYGDSEIIQRASELADLNGFYNAFGLELSGEFRERPDHLAVETDFMSALCRKEGHGIECGDRELVGVARDAQRKFMRAHLGRWLPAFAQRIQDAAGDEFYGCLARFADAFLTAECARLNVPHGSPYLPLRPADETDESVQSCGVPDAGGAAAPTRFTPLNVSIGRTGRAGS